MDLALGLGQDDEEERENQDLKLTPQREDLLELWKQNPWDFLTAKDPDTGLAIVRTIDQRDNAETVKPFPAHLEYVHYLIDVVHNEPKILIEKARQMFVSTGILLYFFWKCAFRDGYSTLLSKLSEEEAEILLYQKIRQPWQMLPPWLQRQIPASMKPKNQIFFRKVNSGIESTILGLAENAARAKARGQTYQSALIDEAEYFGELREMITAMLPSSNQLVFWSTPAAAGEGVEVFRSYLGDDPVTLQANPSLWATQQKWAHVQGMSVRRNEAKNFSIVRIEHNADPKKRGAEWEAAAIKEMPSVADFRREMKIDRTSNAGKPFHPQFAESPRRFVVRCDQIPRNTTIIRSWDFGGRPACLWSVWDARRKRLWILRELLGIDINTFQFRDLVKYMSGQMSLESLTALYENDSDPRALQMLVSLKDEPAYPAAPWFEGAHRFVDFAGHEGRMGPRGLVKSGVPQTADEILEQGGIHLYSRFTLHSSRTEIINGLSRIAEDGWARILLDPACKLLWEGLHSGIVYDKPTAKNPNPDKPMPHRTYSHLYDCLGYACANVLSVEEADYFKASFGPDGRIIMPSGEDAQVLSYLTGGIN